MPQDRKELLDDIAWRLIEALQDDARQSYAELGRRIGLSPPAVAERMRQLEDRGLIRGYRAEIDAGRVGWTLTAFIRLRTGSDNYAALDRISAQWPEILECHHITGEDAVLLKVRATSIRHLDDIILRLAPFGPTTSSVVLSTRVAGKPASRPPGDHG